MNKNYLILIIVTILLAFNVNGALSEGIVLVYDMEEGSGTLVDEISSVNAVPIAAQNSYGLTGINGNAVNLTGISGGFWIQDNESSNETYPKNEVSCFAWFNPYVQFTDQYLMGMVNFQNQMNKDQGWGINWHSAVTWRHFLYTSAGSLTGTCSGDGYIPINTWTSVGMTINLSKSTNNIKIYVGGVNKCNQSLGGTFPLSPNLPLHTIGNGYFDGSDNGNAVMGLIDEFYCWNRTLKDSEIQELATDTPTSFYPFTATPTLDSLNISTYPPNATIFESTSQLGFFNVTLGALVNSTTDFDCSLVLNSKLNETKSNSSGTNVNITFPFINLLDGIYNFSVNCTNLNNTETSSTNTFVVDTVPPSVSGDILNNNTFWTNQVNYNFRVNMTFLTDSWANDTCNLLYRNTSTGAINNILRNISSVNCTLGQHNGTVKGCDQPSGDFIHCTEKSFFWYNMGRIQIRATDLFGNTINNFTINLNGTFNGNTTNGIYNIDNLTAGGYFVQIVPQDTDIQIDNVSLTLNSTFLGYNFTGLRRSQTLNITFYNSDTSELITGVNITLQIIGASPQTLTTDTGQLNVSLLIPDNYTLTYTATGFRQGRYVIDVLSRSFNQLKLYMQNETNSQLVLIVVNDRFGTKLQNAQVIIQRWQNDSWITDQIVETDFNGQTEAYYVLSNVFYNHVIKYRGVTRFGAINDEDNKKLIFAEDVTNGITFFIDILGIDLLDQLQDLYTINTNLSYVNQTATTGFFRFFWSNPSNLDLRGCLNVTSNDNLTPVCTICSSTSTGIITCNINQSSGTAIYTAYSSLDSLFVDSLILILGQSANRINWGTFGYILAFFIVVIGSFAFLSNPSIAVYVSTGIVVLLTLFGIIFKDLDYVYLIMILVVAHLIARINSRSGVNS